MRLLIDADPMVYRSGFASESHKYHCVAETADGSVVEAFFEAKESKKGKWVTAGSAMKTWLADKTLLDKELVVTPGELSHALHLVQQELVRIKSAVAKRWKVKDTQLIVKVVLTGKDNFRDKIALQRPYKGNRDKAHRPYWYKQIRQYLIDQHNAVVVDGREADDEVSIEGWEWWMQDMPCCVATIDKDLDQVPGLHYDYRQKVFYNINQWQAEKAFWIQCLAGDLTDNIPGCYKIGRETATKLLDEIVPADGVWPTPDEFWNCVVAAYEKSQKIAGCPYPEPASALDVAIETARLVFMQRKPRELWVPPGQPAQWTGAGDD